MADTKISALPNAAAVGGTEQIPMVQSASDVAVTPAQLDTYISATTKTLTNKTLTSPVIATIVNTGTVTLPTATDTLVGRATTDTLTNKTLTAPVISTISNTGTVTLPTATDTLVGKATTDTLTNKTLDTAGTGNVLKINGTQVSAITGTGSVVLATSPTLVTPTIGVATATTVNKVTITAPATSATLTVADGSSLVTSGANSITLTSTGATNVTLPTTGTLATRAGTETLTNKTLDVTSNVTLKDTLFTLQDDGDTTKQAVFQASGITTGTTRTYTFPDYSDTVGVKSQKFHPGFRTGVYYGTPFQNGTANQTITFVTGTVWASPIYIGEKLTINQLYMRLSTGGAANVRLGVYGNSTGASTVGTPGALLYTSESIAINTAALYTNASPAALALTPGWYFLAIMIDTASVIKSETVIRMPELGYVDESNFHIRVFYIGGAALVYASGLPDPFPALADDITKNYGTVTAAPYLLFQL